MNEWRRLTCARNSSEHLSLKHLLKHISHRTKVTHFKLIHIPFITDVRTCYVFRPYAIFKQVVMVILQCNKLRTGA